MFAHRFNYLANFSVFQSVLQHISLLCKTDSTKKQRIASVTNTPIPEFASTFSDMRSIAKFTLLRYIYFLKSFSNIALIRLFKIRLFKRE